MFPYPIATPQGCNIQTFYGTNDSSASQQFSWNKPVGVSHVYMMLIGSGGTGDGTNGGGSGAVTVWYGAAQHVPNNLIIGPSSATGGNRSDILFRSRTGTITLLSAELASGSTAGTATTAGPFAASGFYKSTAGQDGSSSNILASTTTFLSGGANSAGSSIFANYGYENTASSAQGFFQMQPIIVGLGASGSSKGGIGCGGGGTGLGGPGMVLIASW